MHSVSVVILDGLMHQISRQQKDQPCTTYHKYHHLIQKCILSDSPVQE